MSSETDLEIVLEDEYVRVIQPRSGATLVAEGVSAWFGPNKVLDRVSLEMPAGSVTAIIGPSGCGKSTFIRILNRMHELIAGAALAGSVLLDGMDVYGTGQRATDTRKRIGMVFQKPNPFPAMTVYDNVLSGLKLTGTKVDDRDELVHESLVRAGLWQEVKNRLRARAARSPEASSSACASLAPWPCALMSCSWTSRARHSTPRPRAASRKPSSSS